jgi:hypothetical protein
MKKSLLVILVTLFFTATSWATARFVIWAGEELTIAWDYNVVPEPDLGGFYIYCKVPGGEDILAANVTDETARQYTFNAGPCADGNNTFTMSAYDTEGLEGDRSVDSVSKFLNDPPNGIPSNLSLVE